MKMTWTLLAVVTFCILTLTAVRVGAQAVQPTSETYTWSGELVAFEPGSNVLTVKSRAVGGQAVADLPKFKAGDKIILTWSGFDTYANGILRAERYEANKKWSEPFTFPVEFVTYETDRQYVTFKFNVPAASVEAVKAVKPGEWITATSKHRASNEAEAIMAVNAYTAVSSRPSTN
jgi:hypothetical protein